MAEVIEGEAVADALDESPVVLTLDDGRMACNGVVLYETKIATFSKTAIYLAQLTARYKGAVYDVTTTAGMGDAKAARRMIRDVRVALEKFRKEEKAEILERGRAIDNDAKALTASLESLEDPIDAQIKAEEKRKEDERAERERVEAARVAGIRAKIEAIRGAIADNVGKSAGELRFVIDLAKIEPIDKETYQEFMVEADEVKTATVLQLTKMLGAAELLEDQQREIAAREAAVAVERKRQEEADAEQKRKADELVERERKVAAAEKAAEDAKRAAEAKPEPPPVLGDKMVEAPLTIMVESSTISESVVAYGRLVDSLPWQQEGIVLSDRSGALMCSCDSVEIATFIVETLNESWAVD